MQDKMNRLRIFRVVFLVLVLMDKSPDEKYPAPTKKN
jgi:hypothetical protein